MIWRLLLKKGRKMKNIRIGTKLIGGFLLVALLALLLGMVGFLGINELSEDLGDIIKVGG